ncbi:nicotinate-nucleotide--dimethylbenzimidazole phosphoribosyltransferase [Solirubrobacter ginsenosidimutans]|uniref:Nicotinate-nucleotide--dimethylbenzimidazole phosphoribosyltransferase n=1 Tax=Solirubrobacter ginsenosidimutans TaxID=490573 RepID=A0A9X3S6Z0_9ACTN|nr:nicotinate-nucleotide--dimethylbenzimidazole phosphoribosyltransferase [Solirubrobacter ginsenosidimutans]MDA0167342.1 nicotinate-nucleotide--dimethylbenzimidazole phosphoribosyltransferase [Solirubrobacter ginsenosidimutans]
MIDLALRPLDTAAMDAARARQGQLVKPPGSLGRLEELAIWLAGATGDARPTVNARVVVAAADHGVSGVSAYPREVTAQMLATFLAGGGAVSVLARETGAELVCVDAGVDADTSALDVVRTGLSPSGDLTTQDALTERDVTTAIDTGRDLAAQAAQDGITVLVGGEMGIGNTTPATCLACWLTGGAPEELAGPGTGLDPEGVKHKADVIARALALHRPSDPLEALSTIGGGEIAVLTGLALGAGEHGLAYICDGLIATAAAAIAVAIAPDLRPRLLAGHRSPEPAHTRLLEHLQLEPVLELQMRLGEASGAVAALAILRLAAATHDGMLTFAEAGVSG